MQEKLTGPDQFRAYREAAGLSRTKLSVLIGAAENQNYIERIESGKKPISHIEFGKAMKICKLLHITPKQLLACDNKEAQA